MPAAKPGQQDRLACFGRAAGVLQSRLHATWYRKVPSAVMTSHCRRHAHSCRHHAPACMPQLASLAISQALQLLSWPSFHYYVRSMAPWCTEEAKLTVMLTVIPCGMKAQRLSRRI